MLLSKVILKSRLELQGFKSAYTKLSGAEISNEYLEQARVVGFFDEKRVLQAGYIVNAKAPFRYLSYIPEGEKSSISGYDYLSHNATEITCIFMHKKNLDSWQRLQVYANSGLDAQATGKKFLLGGSNVAKIARIQKLAMRHDLWSGSPTYATNDDIHQEVYYAERTAFVLNILAAYPGLLLSEFFRKRQSSTSIEASRSKAA